MASLDPTVVAVIGTIMGGVGLKVAEHWLGRNKVKVDDASRLRDELRIEITTQKEEIRQLELEIKDLKVDVDNWRAKYYELFQKYMALETDLKLALHNIKNEVETAQATTADVAQQPPPTPTPTIP